MGNSGFLYVRNCVVQSGERLNEYVNKLAVFGFEPQVEIGNWHLAFGWPVHLVCLLFPKLKIQFKFNFQLYFTRHSGCNCHGSASKFKWLAVALRQSLFFR